MHGIVIIKIYSNNKKANTLYTVVTSHSYIPPKCVKTRESKDKHCVLWCTYISYNICDPIPLDNLKNHTALLYITWRLIQDPKNKAESSQLRNFTGLSSGISKIRERKKAKCHVNKAQISKERRKILVVKFITETASEISRIK